MNRTALLAVLVVLAAAVLVLLGYIVGTVRAPSRLEIPSPVSTPPSPPLVTPSPSPAFVSPAPLASPTTQATVRVTDKADLFSFEIPSTWRITANEPAKGLRLTSLTAESPDFVLRQDASAEEPFVPQYYERGAQLSIHVTRGTVVLLGDRRESGALRAEDITIDGEPGRFRVMKEPSTFAGHILEATANHGGNNVLFRLYTNPDAFPEGETIFRNILASFRFTR